MATSLFSVPAASGRDPATVSATLFLRRSSQRWALVICFVERQGGLACYHHCSECLREKLKVDPIYKNPNLQNRYVKG